jgi:molybdopterin converting factor small subunit
MIIKVRTLGILSEASGSREILIQVPEKSTIGSAIKQIIADNKSLDHILWDKTVDSPTPNALILLDGVEINNLNGLETQLEPNQEIVLLPVVHGG